MKAADFFPAFQMSSWESGGRGPRRARGLCQHQHIQVNAAAKVIIPISCGKVGVDLAISQNMHFWTRTRVSPSLVVVAQTKQSSKGWNVRTRSGPKTEQRGFFGQIFICSPEIP